METWTRDLRYALRSLAHSPLFTCVAVLTLAFGIGVNATIFTFVNSILLRPLPVEAPDELLAVYSSWPEETYGTSSFPDYLDLRDQNDVFSDVIGHSMAIANLQHEGQSDLLVGELVTGNYFTTLGIRATRGRTLLPEDDAGPGSARAVVLSHGLWQRRFGGEDTALGAPARFNGQSYEVVGIAPESFPGLMPGVASDYWIAVSHVEEIDAAGQIHSAHGDPGRTLLERRGYRWMWIKGRLVPDTAPSQAEAQLATVMNRLAEEHQVTNRGKTALVLPVADVRFHPDVDKVLGPAAAVLLGAVALVLLIVCANLANMLLSRAQGRQREIAIRLALGAGRGRLVRQLLTESLTISILGSAGALLLAHGSTKLLIAYKFPIPLALRADLGVDGRVVFFTALLAFAAAVVFGLVPALQASRPDLVPALKQGAKTSAGSTRFFNLKNALVMVQVAVSLVLLVTGALLTRGLSEAESVDVGIDTERVAAVPIQLEMHGYEREEADVFFRTLKERVAALPGVESAAVATRVPFDINMHNSSVYPDVMDLDADHAGFATEVTWVDPDYFVTVGATLVQGRNFDSGDTRGAQRVAIVNAAMARRYWSEGGALGESFRTGGIDAEPYEIIGVVADYKVRTVGEEPRPMVHFSRGQRTVGYAYMLARATGEDASQLAQTVRREALAMDPQLAFTETSTLGDLMEVSLYPVRMGAALLGAFGLLALVLASVGLYGVIAYSVSRRDRELGVRVAMGARPWDVVGLVLRGGMTLVLAGSAVGLVLSVVLSRFVSSLLYGLSAVDPVAFIGAASVLVAVAFIANFVPAARASRVDPLTALRQE